MRPRSCSKCAKVFAETTARYFYGRGRRIWNSKYCSIACRELARLGRLEYERRLALPEDDWSRIWPDGEYERRVTEKQARAGWTAA